MNKQPIMIAAVVLGAFAAGGVGLVALTHDLTEERIAYNERAAMLNSLEAIVPADTFDNDLLNDSIEVKDPELLGSNSTQVYRARNQGQPIAVVLDTVVPNGYAGPIMLLVAVLKDGTLGGVRVLAHHETPGLGDRLEEKKSDWIHDFTGRSLDNPSPDKWKVKRDGGLFDQFTGATITPRSIVEAVKNTLLFVEQQGDALYRKTAIQAPKPTGTG